MIAPPPRSALALLIAAGIALVFTGAAPAQTPEKPTDQTSGQEAGNPVISPPATAADYGTAVVARINSVKLNAAALRETGATGLYLTRVKFVIGADGRLVGSAVDRTSGNVQHDNLAMLQIRTAEPFPPFAADMGDADQVFTIEIRTDLTEAEPDAPAAE